MPTYSYLCETCQTKFELTILMSDYDGTYPKCPNKDCPKSLVQRDLQSDLPRTFVKLGDDQLKLGHLGKRNTERISKDEQTHLYKKHNEYKYTEPTKELPSGMNRIERTPTNERKPSKTQKRRDPKRQNRST